MGAANSCEEACDSLQISVSDTQREHMLTSLSPSVCAGTSTGKRGSAPVDGRNAALLLSLPLSVKPRWAPNLASP